MLRSLLIGIITTSVMLESSRRFALIHGMIPRHHGGEGLQYEPAARTADPLPEVDLGVDSRFWQ